MKSYLVGGAVRDELLGLKVEERDWVLVGASPETMLSQGYKQVGKDFPVFLHPHTGEEYALARRERKTGEGYTGFTCDAGSDVTLEEDLLRRDLTINAMAKDEAGQIIDPYHGQDDLNQRLLRHVSPAFVEDPLRVLRVARFAARFAHLGFIIAKETMALMRELAKSGELNALVAERVSLELSKALTTATPSQFFTSLRICGANAVLFPELEQLFGVPATEYWHPEIDTGVHTLMVLNQAAKLSDSFNVRFAALTHDFGKALTPQTVLPSHHGHEKKGLPLVKALCERLKIAKDTRELALLVTQYHGHCHRVKELTPAKLVTTLDGLDAFRRPERFEDFLLACEADARGRVGFEASPYPQANYFRQALALAAAVPVQPILDKGVEGAAIKHELHQARTEAIRHWKQTV